MFKAWFFYFFQFIVTKTYKPRLILVNHKLLNVMNI